MEKIKNFYYSLQYRGKRYQGSTGTSDKDQAFEYYLDIKNKITKNKLHFADKTFKELAIAISMTMVKTIRQSFDISLNFLEAKIWQR